jgi:hypothetical protein
MTLYILSCFVVVLGGGASRGEVAGRHTKQQLTCDLDLLLLLYEEAERFSITPWFQGISFYATINYSHCANPLPYFDGCGSFLAWVTSATLTTVKIDEPDVHVVSLLDNRCGETVLKFCDNSASLIFK